MMSIMQRHFKKDFDYDDVMHVWVCTTRMSILWNTRTVETATKDFAPSFVRLSHSKAYIMTRFALI